MTITRRECVGVLGGAAICPIAARGQQAAVPVIGFLSSQLPSANAEWVAAFRGGLKEAGFIEGQNVHIAFRWAEGRYEQLPALAAELVQNHVAVLAATGGLPSALAAKEATKTLPIVVIASDPVVSGLVASINRPGGNITGVSPLNALLETKRLGLLHELVPTARQIGVLTNPAYPEIELRLKEIQAAALTLGLELHIAETRNEADIDAAFAGLVQRKVDALLVTSDPFFTIRSKQIVTLAARHSIPSIHGAREIAAAGGLASYGPSFRDAYHQAGVYTGRILKGEKPADMPIIQSIKFEFIINLKTAKGLGLTIPPGLLAIVDEVIE